MTLVALPRTASRSAVAPAAPGLTERLLIIGVIFMNQFGTPASWFTVNTGAASGPTDDFLLSYGSFAVIAVLSIGLVGNGDAVVKLLQAEPLMVVYFFFLGMSPIWSDRFGESLTAAANLLAMMGLAIILLIRFRPREIFQLITVAFVVGILLDLFWILAMGPLGRNATAWDGLGTQKNALGNHGLLGVVIFLMAARLFRRFRVPFYSLAVLSIVILVGSQSKTSLGAGLVAAASFVVFLAFRARRTMAGAVAITLVAGCVFTGLLVTANLDTVAGQLGRDTTFSGRTALWTEVWRGVVERPWLGYGYDGFWGGPLSASHRISAYPQFDWGPNHSHNALFESALHVGIPLTIIYLLFNLRALVRATNHVRWVRGPIGLFPLVYLTIVTLVSITESGIFTQRFGTTLYVIAIIQAKIGVDEAKRSGVLRLDRERQLARSANRLDLTDNDDRRSTGVGSGPDR